MGDRGLLSSALQLTRLPDSLLLEVFCYLSAQSLGRVACTCVRFSRIAHDELLWMAIFRRDFKIPFSVSMHPQASSWRSEYRRLLDESPAVMCEELIIHKDQVLHVSFSHNGQMFATTSKDGKVMVWNAANPCTLRFSANMTKQFRWRYTQFSQFNKSDTLLLVSGVHNGNMTTTGEIAVFDLEEFTLQSRIDNKPYDVFGTWYDNHHLFSGTLYWTGHLQSTSAIRLSKASQEVDSERLSVMMNLYRFPNISASTIRTIMVAEVPVVNRNAHPTLGKDLMICSKCGLFIHDNSIIEQECDFSFKCDEENSTSSEEFHCRSAVMDLKDTYAEKSKEYHDKNNSKLYDGSLEMDWDESKHYDSEVTGDHENHPSSIGKKLVSNQNSLLLTHSSTSEHDILNHGNDESSYHYSLLDPEIHLVPDSQLSISPSSVSGFLRCCCKEKDTNSLSKKHLNSLSRSPQGELSDKDNYQFLSSDSKKPTLSDRLNSKISDPYPSAKRQRSTSYSSDNGFESSFPKHAPDIPRTTSSAQLIGESSQTEKLLIFTMGEETYTPHLIGIKRIKLQDIRGQEDGNEEGDWLDGNLLPNVDRNMQGLNQPMTTVDHKINMHGHIVGMALSPDQRYLYVNSRQWPPNYTIESVLEPPPIAQEIDIHVIDLLTFQEVGTVMRSHKAFTPNDECFFLFLDVSEQYVASGAEDRRGYLWDRHYGVHLRCFPHSDVVNSVAFNPRDQQMLVTVSDDNKIKVWRSRRKMREILHLKKDSSLNL